jgi:hypothetical protein
MRYQTSRADPNGPLQNPHLGGFAAKKQIPMNSPLKSKFLSIIWILSSCLVLAQDKPVRQAQGKPNILLIFPDDHTWQTISAYEHPLSKVVPTPNIDRIADEGIRFDRCLVTNSICAPSRAVVLTGKYSHLRLEKRGSTQNVNIWGGKKGRKRGSTQNLNILR